MDTIHWVFLLIAFGVAVWGLRKIGLGPFVSFAAAIIGVIILGQTGLLDRVVQLSLIALGLLILAKIGMWVARMAKARREQAQAAAIRSPEFRSF